ncbi:hypothetical protein B0H19DRAFT_925654, partial [Mycena capillaripes]
MNKYSVNFEAVLPTEAIQREMPFWHHPGEDPDKKQINNGKRASCLRRNHNIKTLGDALDLTERLKDPAHEKSASCLCSECIDDRTTRSCKDPHMCVTAAADRMKHFLPKWVVKNTHTSVDAEQHPTAKDQDYEEARFISPKGIETLTQGLRALTNRKTEAKERPPTRVRRGLLGNNTPVSVTVHISSATHILPRTKKRAAAGTVYGINDSRNKGFRVPVDEDQTQYVAEILA